MIAKRGQVVRPLGVPRHLHLVVSHEPEQARIDPIAAAIIAVWFALGLAAWVVALWWMLS